jgi:hypothetical protein
MSVSMLLLGVAYRVLMLDVDLGFVAAAFWAGTFAFDLMW